jgi:uncharacterized membrane protein YtjA (UPF0391 family)
LLGARKLNPSHAGKPNWLSCVLSSDGAPAGAKLMEDFMLGWALTFLVIALIAALLGFGGVAGTAVGIAKIIFFVAIVLFLISAVAGAMRGRGV